MIEDLDPNLFKIAVEAVRRLKHDDRSLLEGLLNKRPFYMMTNYIYPAIELLMRDDDSNKRYDRGDKS